MEDSGWGMTTERQANGRQENKTERGRKIEWQEN
jgi:hypothetical protein